MKIEAMQPFRTGAVTPGDLQTSVGISRNTLTHWSGDQKDPVVGTPKVRKRHPKVRERRRKLREQV